MGYVARRSIWPLALIVFCPVSVSAEPAKPDYAKAYALAMRCFVASGGKQDQAHARPAFDAAVKLGQAMGFENARINVDFDWAISRESAKLAKDSTYREATLATCRKFGWAGN